MKYLLTLALAAVLLMGCGKSFDELSSNVQERFQALEQAGLPDSLIVPIRMSFTNAQMYNRRNRGNEANNHIRTALTAVERAEKYLAQSQENKPAVVERRNALAARAEADLRGLHRADADSILAVVDSFLNINFVFRAQAAVQQFEDNFSDMQAQQATADSIRSLVIGTWVFADTTRHAFDSDVNAVQRRTFTFNRNGTARLIEEKRGQSAPNLREEWRFETRGTWDLRGNVIHITANHWQAADQRFWTRNDQTGRWGNMNHETNVWTNDRPNVVPAETLESDHPDISGQNRFISFPDLQRDFRRQR